MAGRRLVTMTSRPSVQRELISTLLVRPVGGSSAPKFWRGLSEAAAPHSEEAEAEVAAPQKEKPLLASPDPRVHRADDVGKIYRIDPEELKKIFPEGLCGELHNVLYGKRTKEEDQRNDKWWDLVLKDAPGILIRKQAMQLISSLYCLSKNGVKKGNPRINTAGFLLDGASGSGKSTILNHVVHWARMTGDWFVIFVPQAHRLVSGLGYFARRDPEPGPGKIILNPGDAQPFLAHMVAANADKAKKIPFIKNISQFEAANIAEAVQQLQALSTEQRHAQAMDCFLDVLDSIRVQTEFPVLLAIDEFNSLLGTSLYMDYQLKLIPCKDVEIAAALARFTPDAFARGVTVGASTRTGQFCNIPLPKPLSKQHNKHLIVDNYSREDIKRYMTYLYNVQNLFTPVTEDLVDYMHFTTQGRARIVEEYCGCEVFNHGLHNLPKTKQVGRWYRLNEGGPDTLFDPRTGKAQRFYTHMELRAAREAEEARKLAEDA